MNKLEAVMYIKNDNGKIDKILEANNEKNNDKSTHERKNK